MRVIAEKRRQLAALRVNCERVRDSVRRKPESRRLRKLLADERVQVTIMRGVISELEKIRKQEKDAFWRAQAVRRKSMALEAIDFEGLPKLAPEATRAEELQAIFGLLQHNQGRWLRQYQIVEAIGMPEQRWRKLREAVVLNDQVEIMGRFYRWKVAR